MTTDKKHDQKPSLFTCPICAITTFAIVIDKNARIKDENSNYVFIINDNFICEKREIVTGIINGDNLEVVEGINEGERIVINGQNKLKGGEKVIIIN